MPLFPRECHKLIQVTNNDMSTDYHCSGDANDLICFRGISTKCPLCKALSMRVAVKKVCILQSYNNLCHQLVTKPGTLEFDRRCTHR